MNPTLGDFLEFSQPVGQKQADSEESDYLFLGEVIFYMKFQKTFFDAVHLPKKSMYYEYFPKDQELRHPVSICDLPTTSNNFSKLGG